MKLEIKINQKMKVYYQPSKIKKDKNWIKMKTQL